MKHVLRYNNTCPFCRCPRPVADDDDYKRGECVGWLGRSIARDQSFGTFSPFSGLFLAKVDLYSLKGLGPMKWVSPNYLIPSSPSQ
ncbi:hypothetical protein NPIL_25231 [Nephila pilipes]|nr:hypothetical protein NPIL_107651 [Nephila pilipes]GFU20444.1 hypothetical protein NPIL_25231 [Nephila pilipes]